MTTLKQLRVVIASPSDVKKEREALDKVIEEVNDITAEGLGLTLKTVRWETDSYPGFHVDGIQEGLIDPIIKIVDCDILICIFWKKFGTPIKKGGKTGTEHEFYKAYEAWKQNNKPYIMLYFNQKEYFPKTSDEIKQQLYIFKFKGNLPKEGFSWNYNGLEQFKELAYRHITKYLQNKFKPESTTLKNQQDITLTQSPLHFLGEKRIFVGREDYINKKIKDLIKQPGSRVSFVGPGGSGKSQLAFKALHQYYEKDKIIDLVIPVYLSAISSLSTTTAAARNVSTSFDNISQSNAITTLTISMTFKKFLNDIGFYLIKKNILPLSEQVFNQLDIENAKSEIYKALSSKKYPILYCDNFETLSYYIEENKKEIITQNSIFIF